MNNPIDIEVLLLVGGKGTRLRPVVPDTPKPLAIVGERSFLEIIVRQLHARGFTKVIMCSGHLADQVEETFGDGSKFGISIQYSREKVPLGTGGAIKQAAARFVEPGARFIVMNGDSFVGVDFQALLRFHQEHTSDLTVVLQNVEDTSKYGTVNLGIGDRIERFSEKTGDSKPGLVNAGVYVFEYSILDWIPDGSVSLEREVFSRIPADRIYGFKTDGIFIDIGTPENFMKAQQISAELMRVAEGVPE